MTENETMTTLKRKGHTYILYCRKEAWPSIRHRNSRNARHRKKALAQHSKRARAQVRTSGTESVIRKCAEENVPAIIKDTRTAKGRHMQIQNTRLQQTQTKMTPPEHSKNAQAQLLPVKEIQ